MAELPRVELVVNASGRGFIKVDGIELRDVHSIAVDVKAGRLTTVTVGFPATVEFSADEASVLVNRGWAVAEGGQRTNGEPGAEIVREDDGT